MFGFKTAVSKASTLSNTHQAGCPCPKCNSFPTVLFATEVGEEVPSEVAEEVPSEVAAMDGIDSPDEAHNAERPARKSISKKKAGKPLEEFNVGDSVSAKIRSITSYGAFVDFGASTDGLLHISQVSTEFVENVSDVLKEGDTVDVRITNIDVKKSQVGLTMLTEEQEAAAKQQAERPKRPQRQQNNRRDDSAVLSALSEKGFDSSQFVEGTVVSTVDFGAFVRVDASLLNSEVSGELDGLVHISALSVGRAASVTSVVNVDDKVQVRCKSISGGKVSLTMISVEDEQNKMSDRAPPVQGAKDWKEQMEKLQNEMDVFANKPLVVDMR